MRLSRLLGALALITTLAAVLPAQALPPIATDEGFDKQSPEEILRANLKIQAEFANAINPAFLPPEVQARMLAKYRFVDPTSEVPQDLLHDAILYFDANKDKFPNQAFISIVDFAPRSDKYRFFLINMANGAVEKYHTTHGWGSDPKRTGTATVFGNVENSGMSSLGPIKTADAYTGKYKVSLRLDGLVDTNSNIRERSIIFHGWDNVHEADVIQGWSWGCITMDWKFKDAVLDKIKDGSLVYVGQSKK